jgi:adenosylcobyric acid synthase
MGRSGEQPPVSCSGEIYGSYVHGLFDEGKIAAELVAALCDKKGVSFTEIQQFDFYQYKEQQYDRLADTVRQALDMGKIYQILEEGI